MNGAHRLNPAARRARAVRSLLTGLAVAGAVAAAGLTIYLIVAGTNLRVWIVLWIVSVALLFGQVVRRKRDVGLILLAASWVATSSWQLVSEVAHDHHWAANQVSVIGSVGSWVRWAMLACIAVGIAIDIKSGSLTWPPWRPSSSD